MIAATITITLALFWIACSVLTYGMYLAHLQKAYPTIAEKNYRQDCGTAFFTAVWGPFGLWVIFLSTGFAQHGFQYSRRRK